MDPLTKLLKPTNEDPIEKAIKNNPCGLCRQARRPICLCKKGGGGGPDSPTSSLDDSDTSKEQISALAALDLKPIVSTIQPINFEKLENALILEDKADGTITIKIVPGSNPDAVAEARKTLRLIKTAFEEFKAELVKRGLDVSGLTSISTSNSLTLHFPNPLYHDAFIEQLTNKKLLPAWITKQLLAAEEPTPASSLSPFATKPAPKANVPDDEAPKDDTNPEDQGITPFRTQFVLKNEPW